MQLQVLQAASMVELGRTEERALKLPRGTVGVS